MNEPQQMAAVHAALPITAQPQHTTAAHYAMLSAVNAP